MVLLLVFAGVTIGASFICSLLEASLLSLSPSYAKSLAQTHPTIGRMLEHMKDAIDRPLAAILSFNTIANTAGAVAVGAQAEKLFGDRSIGITSALMTLLILIVSEIIPKTLGVIHARTIVGFTVYATRAMMVVGWPLLFLIERISGLLRRTQQQELISRAELLTSIRLGHHHGALEPNEYRVINNVLALRQVRLKDVMTPRTVVFSLPAAMTVSESLEQHKPMRFARFPVYGDSPDDIKGYVARFHIHEQQAEGRGEVTLGELARPVAFLPRTASVADAMEQMLRSQRHIAVVVDEHGGTDGIITLEDTIETLIGQEIVDETDTVVDMRAYAKRKTGG